MPRYIGPQTPESRALRRQREAELSRKKYTRYTPPPVVTFEEWWRQVGRLHSPNGKSLARMAWDQAVESAANLCSDKHTNTNFKYDTREDCRDGILDNLKSKEVFTCQYCGEYTTTDPSDQEMPLDICHHDVCEQG